LFNTGLGAFGGAVATAGIGSSTSGGYAPASAMAPGSAMASSGSSNPFAPTHPAGVAFWVGVTSVALLCLLWYSLPE
jgi:hypothetical protein